MNLKQLEYFTTLAKMQHYTKAAAELYITQPSLSYSISELEKELNTQLFEKEGRNVRLTKYGGFFLSYVEKALKELEMGKEQLLKLTSPTEGKIDLAFIYTLGPNFVPTMIQAFFNKVEYKNIKFSFAQGSTQDLVDGLKQGKFDLVFCSYAENEPDIDFVPIAQQELVVIVPNDHPLAKLESIDLGETSPYPFIFFNHKSGLRPIIDDMFKCTNITPNIVCEVEEDGAVAGLVAINYGIAVIPKIPALKNFNVKILKIKKPVYERFIYVASAKKLYHTPAMNSFRSFAINYGKENYLDIDRKI